jgi:GH24 family phage-related lysozyme (muramidase)
MASNRIIGLNPFEAAILTPGPLGLNDAASPDTPFWFIGNTPGPLGFNDHADPKYVALKEKNTRKVGSPASSMRISQEGLEFIWSEEYVEGISEHLHWPGGASGVTLGAGYDMRSRTKEEVMSDLITIGVDVQIARKVAEGAGLVGQDANSFVRQHRKLLEIRDDQAICLLKLIIKGYERIVQRGVKVPLQQHEFDALVSFAYNPGGRFKRIANYINSGEIEEAMDEIKSAITSGGKVLKGLVIRRQHEVDLFVQGKYQV